MFLFPNSEACAELYGEGTDVEDDEDVEDVEEDKEIESCWLIERKNGSKVIMTEEKFEKYKNVLEKVWGEEIIVSITHYFSINTCKERNPTATEFQE